jgi:alginate O-acetyltransferase complex protein AlgI
MQNFNYPYFSKDIKQFWNKWNISLTSWLRDYIFLPVAFLLTGKIKTSKLNFAKTDIAVYSISIFVTWIISGLWHGAKYTFILWGCLQGIFLIVNTISKKPRKRLLKRLNIPGDNPLLAIADVLVTIAIIMFSWIFFRAENIGQAFGYISGIFSASAFSIPGILPHYIILIVIAFFFYIEWQGRKYEYAIANFTIIFPGTVRWIFYFLIISVIFFFAGKEQQFIYFKF